mmetsp:Transcript_7060/g.27063  ORF Transcript_7060/g.27063 Transcript_7060/m.27063 type:complete len:498 (-) Transcript_7060:217-1710(-)
MLHVQGEQLREGHRPPLHDRPLLALASLLALLGFDRGRHVHRDRRVLHLVGDHHEQVDGLLLVVVPGQRGSGVRPALRANALGDVQHVLHRCGLPVGHTELVVEEHQLRVEHRTQQRPDDGRRLDRNLHGAGAVPEHGDARVRLAVLVLEPQELRLARGHERGQERHLPLAERQQGLHELAVVGTSTATDVQLLLALQASPHGVLQRLRLQHLGVRLAAEAVRAAIEDLAVEPEDVLERRALHQLLYQPQRQAPGEAPTQVAVVVGELRELREELLEGRGRDVVHEADLVHQALRRGSGAVRHVEEVRQREVRGAQVHLVGHVLPRLLRQRPHAGAEVEHEELQLFGRNALGPALEVLGHVAAQRPRVVEGRSLLAGLRIGLVVLLRQVHKRHLQQVAHLPKSSVEQAHAARLALARGLGALRKQLAPVPRRVDEADQAHHLGDAHLGQHGLQDELLQLRTAEKKRSGAAPRPHCAGERHARAKQELHRAEHCGLIA